MNTFLHRRTQEKYFCIKAEYYRESMQMLIENISIYAGRKGIVFIE
jgi:hypothetical protein